MVTAAGSQLRSYAVEWFATLDRPAAETLLRFLADQNSKMHFPEGAQKGHAGFRNWHSIVTSRFLGEVNELNSCFRGISAIM